MKDYYEILEVHPKASKELIKKAYQILAKKYHPDLCGNSRESIERMTILNEAYAVLSDENARKKYDLSVSYRNTSPHSHTNEKKSTTKPQTEEDHKFTKACNLAYINGEKPFNGQIILARYWGIGTTFLCTEDYDRESGSYITQYWLTFLFLPILPINRYRVIEKASQSFIVISKIPYPGNFIKKTLSMYNRNKIGVLATLALILCFIFSSYSQPQNNYPSQKKPIVSNISTPKSEPQKNVTSKYIDNEPVLNNSGLGSITLDNSKNNAPVYARIWAEGNDSRPVRTFTVAAHAKFTASKVSPGNYTVRYKFLYENKDADTASKSEPFNMEETKNSQGTNYHNYTLTLYTVQNGNTKTKTISPSEI